MNSGSRSNRAAAREAIGERLRAQRMARKLKAKDLAAKLGVRADSLSQMELGRQAIPAELLVAWCSELKAPLLTIATGAESTPAMEELPPRHARLYQTLTPAQQQLVLEHLELVAKFAGADANTQGKE